MTEQKKRKHQREPPRPREQKFKLCEKEETLIPQVLALVFRQIFVREDSASFLNQPKHLNEATTIQSWITLNNQFKNALQFIGKLLTSTLQTQQNT